MGLSLSEMDEMEEGMVMDMVIEASNDHCEYKELANQEDFDRF